MIEAPDSIPAAADSMIEAPGPGNADPLSLSGLERLAHARLPSAIWDFIAGGSGSETTLTANRRALDALSVFPRVLGGPDKTDAEALSMGTTLLGTVMRMPVAVAPMAYQRLMHHDGELAMAAAALGAGVPMVASTLSSHTIEDIAATGADVWFQLYWLRDRKGVEALIDRAESAGSRALMVTVDVPIMGRRLRDIRNGFTLPSDVVAANLDEGATSSAHHLKSSAYAGASGASAVASHTAELLAPALSWQDLGWLRARTALPLVVKGVLDPRDAVRAVEMGADAIVVSNHGGRQLDGAPPSIVALPAVVGEVGRHCEVIFDSGVRTGGDVLRALALGASAVLVGRPLLWALALDGADGVSHALGLLATEIGEALTLAGCADVAAAGHLRTHQGAFSS